MSIHFHWPLPGAGHSRTKYIELDTRRCQACWQCVAACPNHVLGKVNLFKHAHARVDHADACQGCKKCVRACPQQAIRYTYIPPSRPPLSPELNGETPLNKPRPQPLNTRALAVLVMAIAMLILPVAGIALHFASVSGAPFQPERHLLMTIHNLAGAIFLVATAVHLKLNWRPLRSYLQAASGKLGTYRRELLVATLSVAAPLALGIAHVFRLAR
jgi:2-oxoglutarate ferredoxin oxidoreductase subunit delta